ncbi:uncharacterized protein VP01_362g25 [Puccinia sorghi]|uniref:Uncharacterized protein n=1 Tax=Puccinia sorghi TaxID=27349 RepID=A0A0L6UUS5_9BASI|nr:uncharacterized protein VP01_362g25 [Puccinia sorghi]
MAKTEKEKLDRIFMDRLTRALERIGLASRSSHKSQQQQHQLQPTHQSHSSSNPPHSTYPFPLPHHPPTVNPIQQPIAFPIPQPTGNPPPTSPPRITPCPTHNAPSSANHPKQTPVTIDLTASTSSSESIRQPETPVKKTPSKAPKKQPEHRLNASNRPPPHTSKNGPHSTTNSALKTPTKSSQTPGGGASPSAGSPLADRRCAGTTKQGKPCSRKPMKTLEGSKINMAETLDHLDTVLASSTPPPNSAPVVPRFCFQHYQMVQSQSGSFVANSQWIQYSEWIDEGLPEGVKITLKTEMAKQPSCKDEQDKGYLYCHEMRPDASTGEGTEGASGVTYIKVGRSIRPVARLGEWERQCRSRAPIVRAFFPGSGGSTSYLNGVQSVGASTADDDGSARDGGGMRFHRKWERLVLLELAGWASIRLPLHNSQKSPCIDCGKLHTEIFALLKGDYETLVKPIIEKWLLWCSFAYN